MINSFDLRTLLWTKFSTANPDRIAAAFPLLTLFLASSCLAAFLALQIERIERIFMLRSFLSHTESTEITENCLAAVRG